MGNEFYGFAFWIVAVIISVTASEKMARSRKRDVEGWMLLSAFLGPLVLIALRYLGEAPPQTAEEKLRLTRLSFGLSTALVFGVMALMGVSFFRACFRI